METTQEPTLFSDRLAWGVTLLAVSMLIEVIVAIYGLSNLNMQFDPEMMVAPTITPLQTAVGCLAPFITLARLIGVLLIAFGSRQLAGQQRKLAWGGLGAYLLSLLLTIAVFVLSITATTQGSLPMLNLANGLSSTAALLGLLGLVLLVFSLSSPALRMVLLGALLLYAIGQGGAMLLTVSNTTLETYEMFGTTYYLPNVNIERTSLGWIALSVATVAAQALFLLAFAILAVTGWRALGSNLPDTVS